MGFLGRLSEQNEGQSAVPRREEEEAADARGQEDRGKRCGDYHEWCQAKWSSGESEISDVKWVSQRLV